MRSFVFVFCSIFISNHLKVRKLWSREITAFLKETRKQTRAYILSDLYIDYTIMILVWTLTLTWNLFPPLYYNKKLCQRMW